MDGWVVQFHPGRPGILGLITESERRIDIWVRPAQSSKEVAAGIVHELAHAFNYDYFTPDMRKTWLEARNLSPDTSWYPPCRGCGNHGLCNDCSDYRFGSGDFAECTSRTLQGPVGKFRSLLGPPPNKQQKEFIRQWLSTLSKTAGK